jgi:hypothetical protein
VLPIPHSRRAAVLRPVSGAKRRRHCLVDVGHPPSALGSAASFNSRVVKLWISLCVPWPQSCPHSRSPVNACRAGHEAGRHASSTRPFQTGVRSAPVVYVVRCCSDCELKHRLYHWRAVFIWMLLCRNKKHSGRSVKIRGIILIPNFHQWSVSLFHLRPLSEFVHTGLPTYKLRASDA